MLEIAFSLVVAVDCRDTNQSAWPPIVTVATELPAQLIQLGFGLCVKNLGFAQSLLPNADSSLTKVRLLHQWLEDQLMEGPDRLAVYIDSDVCFGGCTFESFRKFFLASQKRVVLSAEMGLHPSTNASRDAYDRAGPARLRERDHAFGRMGLPPGDLYGPVAATGCHHAKVGPCSNPPAYSYLNSGFMVGTIGALAEMLRGVIALDAQVQWSRLSGGDQEAFHLFYLEHQATIGLDYAGNLCLSTHALHARKILTPNGRGVRNRRTGGEQQCFLHFNGPTKRHQANALARSRAPFNTRALGGDSLAWRSVTQCILNSPASFESRTRTGTGGHAKALRKSANSRPMVSANVPVTPQLPPVAAVVLDPTWDAHLDRFLVRCLLVLDQSVPVHIFYDVSSKEDWPSRKDARLYVHRLPSHLLSSIEAYNKLRLDPRFWRTHLQLAEYLLILERDAVLCSGSSLTLSDFVGWRLDFIGAPFNPGARHCSNEHLDVDSCCCNSGLSLVNVQKIAATLEQLAAPLTSQRGDQMQRVQGYNDLLLMHARATHSAYFKDQPACGTEQCNFSVPSPSRAATFALSEYLPNETMWHFQRSALTPFGVHRPWVNSYLSEPELLALERRCPEIVSLCEVAMRESSSKARRGAYQRQGRIRFLRTVCNRSYTHKELQRETREAIITVTSTPSFDSRLLPFRWLPGLQVTVREEAAVAGRGIAAVQPRFEVVHTPDNQHLTWYYKAPGSGAWYDPGYALEVTNIVAAVLAFHPLQSVAQHVQRVMRTVMRQTEKHPNEVPRWMKARRGFCDWALVRSLIKNTSSAGRAAVFASAAANGTNASTVLELMHLERVLLSAASDESPAVYIAHLCTSLLAEMLPTSPRPLRTAHSIMPVESIILANSAHEWPKAPRHARQLWRITEVVDLRNTSSQSLSADRAGNSSCFRPRWARSVQGCSTCSYRTWALCWCALCQEGVLQNSPQGRQHCVHTLLARSPILPELPDARCASSFTRQTRMLIQRSEPQTGSNAATAHENQVHGSLVLASPQRMRCRTAACARAKRAERLQRLKEAATSARDDQAVAGIFVVWLGSSWPPMLALFLHGTTSIRNAVFYFIGPPLPPKQPRGGNVVSVELTREELRQLVKRHLGVSPALSSLKLCDLKPAWPALFPEISARHSWVGFADIDMILGDLDAELATLQESDELLVPAAMYPHPLANGNFLLFRSTGKMLRVFERIPGWRKALSSRRYAVLDEWWGQTPSLADVLYEMMLNGSLVVRPTR